MNPKEIYVQYRPPQHSLPHIHKPSYLPFSRVLDKEGARSNCVVHKYCVSHKSHEV
jgi:hypothetical protein